MELYTKLFKGKYMDSLETLYRSSMLSQQEGIEHGFVGMANEAFKLVLSQYGYYTETLKQAHDEDLVMVATAVSQEAFDQALEAVDAIVEKSQGGGSKKQSYYDLSEAVKTNPKAKLCSIAVPGEYALEEVKRALNMGLHCVVFSNNVPLEQEREMKELAREKGLLCMGPDCGVANINGAALVLASINNRGPFGICGASGTGIQHVAAILHEADSGVSQTIGTGGNDLKEPVGGIMMLMGIDALEQDPETEYIILISRKPADSVLQKVLSRIKQCRKPVVVLFMGCDKQQIEANGGIWAENLDDCGQKALALIGKSFSFESPSQLQSMAKQAVVSMGNKQKYIRAAFSGGTYMDEAMQTLTPAVGKIWSNKPLEGGYKLPLGEKSREHCCIDYGEEEYTLGRPHPAIDAGIRKPAILSEAMDPETAVLLLDFILTPPGHPDPTGYVLEDIKKAQQLATDRGDKLVCIASVLGTHGDLQDIDKQKRQLEEAGVLVCSTNYRASLLAAEIVKLLGERA